MTLTNRFVTFTATVVFGVVMAAACLAPPSSADDNSTTAQKLVSQGKVLASAKCAACHGKNETGVDGFAPSITSSGALKNYTEAQFEKLMADSTLSTGKPAPSTMPAFNWTAAKADAVYAYLQTLK